MKADNGRCVVLVPVGSYIEPMCEASLRELEARGYAVRRVSGHSAIDQGRSQMATDALRDGFEELMWIDSDVHFEPEAVDRLRAAALPLVCAIYPKKGVRELACHVLEDTEEIIFGKGGGILRLRYAAAGFLLTRREVYDAVRERMHLPTCNQKFERPLIPYFLPMIVEEPEGSWYLGEDYSFCERARQSGFDVHADTTIRLGHVGRYAYSWEDAGASKERFQSYKYRVTRNAAV